jgi:ferredoxin
VKVTVDGAQCTGHGRCYTLAMNVFEPDDEGYSLQRDEPIAVPKEEETITRQAVHACPERAITVDES